MYAIFEHGSHQYRVSEGDQITIDKVHGDEGGEITFEKVLLIAGTDGAPLIGTPVVAGAKVVAKLQRQFRDRKIIIQKFRRRKGYRRRNGHRQHKSTLRITQVVAGP
jgi:large subunit ribosomal protein L21